MLDFNARLSSIPLAAGLLGFAGLIPFVSIATSLWLVQDSYYIHLHQWLLAYAAIILSFMGAVHWGLAISAKGSVDHLQLGISVLPALIAWFASTTTPVWNYSLLIITFACLCVFDTYMVKAGKAPQWYPHLRIPLTVVVIISLIIAQLSL